MPENTVTVETRDAASGQVVVTETMPYQESPAAHGTADSLSASDLGCEPGAEYRVIVRSTEDEAVLLDQVVAAR